MGWNAILPFIPQEWEENRNLTNLWDLSFVKESRAVFVRD